MDIIGSIEADTGCDGNKYQFVEQTESNRLMRGAWEADSGGAEAPQALQAIHRRCTAGEALQAIHQRCTAGNTSPSFAPNEGILVGGNGVAHVIAAGELSDSLGGASRERCAN